MSKGVGGRSWGQSESADLHFSEISWTRKFGFCDLIRLLANVMLHYHVLPLLFSFLSLTHGAIQKVCQESFIMDTFCLERGTLLDNPSVKTLANPEKHTLHCLVDVPRCYDSGFEILGPRNTSTGYCRAFALDANGNALALTLARNTGDCSTCTKSTGGQKVGFRATVKGTYDDAATTLPYALAVDSVEAASVGCDGVEYTPINPCATASGSNPLSATQQLVLAHGSLMMISWGVILPMGVLTAHFLRHRDPTWFKAHRIMQTFGLVCALGGFIIAITQFSVFAPGYYGPVRSEHQMTYCCPVVLYKCHVFRHCVVRATNTHVFCALPCCTVLPFVSQTGPSPWFHGFDCNDSGFVATIECILSSSQPTRRREK